MFSRGTNVVGKAQSAGNGRPFTRAVTQPTTFVPRPFGSRCAGLILACLNKNVGTTLLLKPLYPDDAAANAMSSTAPGAFLQ